MVRISDARSDVTDPFTKREHVERGRPCCAAAFIGGSLLALSDGCDFCDFCRSGSCSSSSSIGGISGSGGISGGISSGSSGGSSSGRRMVPEGLGVPLGRAVDAPIELVLRQRLGDASEVHQLREVVVAPVVPQASAATPRMLL
jgi:hypothetical protein